MTRSGKETQDSGRHRKVGGRSSSDGSQDKTSSQGGAQLQGPDSEVDSQAELPTVELQLEPRTEIDLEPVTADFQLEPLIRSDNEPITEISLDPVTERDPGQMPPSSGSHSQTTLHREGPRSRGKKQGPDPSKLTPDALREAALSYLDRYDASVEQLRRVLLRRVQKYGELGGLHLHEQDVEKLLTRFGESHLLDDARYAVAFARSQHEKGASARKIRQKLVHRGVAAADIDAALEASETSTEQSELEAALAYAKKRRLRERYDLSDRKERDKALASLARQGFSIDIARRALDDKSSE